MGRNNKKYYKDLHQQAYDKLVAMQAFGQSKKAAKRDGTADDKIFSVDTWKTYWKHVKYFTRYIQATHPECTTLKQARKYIREWLQVREGQDLSAWTIQTEAKALNKLYGIHPDDPDYYQPPKRERAAIKRSRNDCERDKHFSVANNLDLIKFCKGTGLRRRELEQLRGGDLISREEIDLRLAQLDQPFLTADEAAERNILRDAAMFEGVQDYISVRNGKGGRKRISPILGKYAPQIVERMRDTGAGDKVWQYVNSNADIHSYRAEYATAIYKAHARPIEEIPYDKVNKGTGRRYQSDVYICRKDEKGKKLDKQAMLYCSKALGHNRLSVVADYYIRAL